MAMLNDSPDMRRVNQDLNRDLIELLLARAGHTFSPRARMKITFWNWAIKSSYALKRGFDLIGAIAVLIVLSPLLLLTVLLIKLDSRGPVIYRQIRVGLNGRQFNFYKFRSMYTDADKRLEELKRRNESADGVIFKMKRDPRVTRVGRFIRKFSIDELPQVFNVLIGDMSLVGPRPPLPREVDQYTLEDRKRLHVIPGITGLWQVSGRSDIPFKQQVMLDKEYIMSQSIWKDLLIMIKTIPAVLTGRGAY